MADRWLFAGGFEAIQVEAGTPSANTTSTTFNSTYADHSISAHSTNRAFFAFVDSSGAADSAVTGETLHVHFAMTRISGSTIPTAGNAVELFDNSGFSWLSLRNTGTTDTYGLFYNSGTGASPTWTQIGSNTQSITNAAVVDIDIWITLGSPHSASWAVNASLKDTGTFTQGSLTSLSKVRLRGSAAIGMGYSELMATTGISLVGAHLYSSKPTGAGSNSGWTGAYTDIDDVAIGDTDAITSGTAAQRSTFAYANVPTLASNEALGEVFLWTRARNSGGAPSNVAPVRRTSGGTDNVGSSFSGISGAYSSLLTRYSGLSETEFNGSEFGVESAT